MSALGVYFGSKVIKVVESNGRKILNSFQIPLAAFSSAEVELEEKVPDEIRMVALFKEELRKNKIVAKQANVTLSGESLVIRTFDMPVIPREDLTAAVNFEARKHIPFKIEELVLDYQVNFDKASQKNLILLVGAKKEALSKYFSLFKELNLKITSIESSAFSILRLLKLSGVKEKGIFGVIDADVLELDEVNFTVLEDGFPVFSRNIALSSTPDGILSAESADPSATLERLKTEIRMSLDYYHRKFPAKKIDNAFFICRQEEQADLGAFSKEIGLTPQFIDVDKCLGKPLPFSLSFLKAYCSSLAKTIKVMPSIDLFSVEAKIAREGAISLESILSFLKSLEIKPQVIFLSLAICIMAFTLGFYQKLSLKKELNGLRSRRPAISSVSPEASYEELSTIDQSYKDKLAVLNNLINKQLYLTEPLDIIPRVIPSGLWLIDFSFVKKEEGGELTLIGAAYLNNSVAELEAVNSFVANLKAQAGFSKYFKRIDIASLERTEGRIDTVTPALTNFTIYCRD